MYARIEFCNFRWMTLNQDKLNKRRDIFKEIDNDLDLADTGKKVIMTESVTGTPNWLRIRFERALAIHQYFGKPALFLTMTTNPSWPEIQEAIQLDGPGLTVHRPDIVNRVFNEKKYYLIEDIYKYGIFGKCIARVGVVEFQKRGLPHCHLIIWLTKEDQIDTIEKVDSLISAEIPDEKEYPELRKIVLEKYVHGPCGQFNPKSACMRKDKKGNLICSKGYPKPFKNRTTFTKKCYPEYRRRTPERGGGSAIIKVGEKTLYFRFPVDCSLQ